MEKEFIYFCRHFWIVLRDIAPFWAAGIVGGSVVSVFAKERLNALFARISRGRFSIFAASAIGVASPLCMYGTVPLAASFSEKGMDDGVLAAFMMSSVLLNPQLMIYTAALGAEALAARTAAAFLCGAAAGFLVRRFFRGGFFNFDGFAHTENRDTDPNTALRLLKNIGRNVRATAPGFLGGVALTAALMRLVPSRAIAGAFGESGFGVAAAALAGVPEFVANSIKEFGSPPRRSRACRSTSAAAARYRCSPNGWAAAWASAPPSPSCSPAPRRS